MKCPRCNTSLEEGAVFCGNCGNKIVPVNAGATASEMTSISPRTNETVISSPGMNSYVQRPPAQYSPSHSYGGPITPDMLDQKTILPPSFSNTPLPASRSSRNRFIRIIFIVVVLALLIVGASGGYYILSQQGKQGTNTTITNNKPGSTPQANTTQSTPPTTNGQATATALLSDSTTGLSDSLKIAAANLSAPPAGSHYAAWLIDEESEKILPLGKLTPQDGQFVVSFNNKGTNLLSQGNKIQITQEQGDTTTLGGPVVLTARFPTTASIHIKHLLLAFTTTPNNVGLIVGLRGQAAELNAQATLLKSASGKNETVKCLAQNIINLTEGDQGSHTSPLNANCAALNVINTGDGFGLLIPNKTEAGYIELTRAHAVLAATQVDSTETIRVHSKHIQIAMQNLKDWVSQIDSAAQALLVNPADTSKIDTIATLANHALNGVDINGNEQIDPIAGEAGAKTGYLHAQLMAQLKMSPGA